MAYTTINKSTDYFNTKLYTGNGNTDHAQTGVGFQPDWTWIKDRSAAESHFVFDAVRGHSKYIFPNGNNAEGTDATGILKSFDSDGFTLGTNDGVNKNSDNYVAWNWKANGQGSSNTDGDITSTVSANTTSGFSIVKYTGTGSNATVGHGLGVAPQVVLIKELNGTNNWLMSHQPLSASLGDYTRFLTLNSTGAVSGAGNVVFQNSAFTSSVFNVGTSAGSNGSGQNYIAYCFASKTGYSKFGTYTGNGNVDGTFLYTGFKPAWILFKETSQSGQSWYIWDTKRDDNGNPLEEYIAVDSNGAEGGSGSTYMDYNSNGVKMRDTGTYLNGSGQTYIYMAFGQSLVGSNNVPCTAR